MPEDLENAKYGQLSNRSERREIMKDLRSTKIGGRGKEQ